MADITCFYFWYFSTFISAVYCQYFITNIDILDNICFRNLHILAPAKPGEVEIQYSENVAILKWAKSKGTVDKYRVCYYEEGCIQSFGETAGSDCECKIPGLKANAEICYRVQSVKNGVYSNAQHKNAKTAPGKRSHVFIYDICKNLYI